MKLFQGLSMVKKSLKAFFSIYSNGDHVFQWSGTVCAILVEGLPRKIPV